MLSITVLALSILAVALQTTATPVQPRQTASLVTYYLQTCVTNSTGDCGSNKNGLVVQSYHTGAGLSDATLGSNVSAAAPAYINGTEVLFDLEPAENITWGLTLGYEPYAAFSPVTINAALAPTEGFSINDTNLVGNETLNDFGGWLACDWWHGVPQLFYIVAGFSVDLNLPSSCSTVNLKWVQM